MKKLVRPLIMILTSMLIISSMSACDTKKAVIANKGPVELQFWDMSWGPKEYGGVASKLVDTFNQSQKSIKVKYQLIPWNNWYQTFSTAISSGSGPDISTGAGYQAFQFAQNDAILPIDDVVSDLKKSGKADEFAPNSIESMKYNGHYVALPWQIDIRALYYRKDIFAKAGLKPPTTWAEFKDTAKKLTTNGVYGFAFPGSSDSTMGMHVLLTFMLNNNGGLFDVNKKTDFMNERNVEAVSFLSSMVKDGSINPASAGFKDADLDKAFGSGTVAMVLNNPGYQNNFPDIKDKIGILDPLVAPHGDKGTFNWINNIMLYKETKSPTQDKVFLKWLSENEKVLFTEGHSGGIPVRTSISSDPYFTENSFTKTIIQKYLPIGKTTSSKGTTLFPELNEIEGDGFIQTMAQKLLAGDDPITIMKSAQVTLNSIMDKAK